MPFGDFFSYDLDQVFLADGLRVNIQDALTKDSGVFRVGIGSAIRLIHSWGNGGQFILAIPELDLLVGITGSNFDEDLIEEQKQIFHMLYSYILPAAASS